MRSQSGSPAGSRVSQREPTSVPIPTTTSQSWKVACPRASREGSAPLAARPPGTPAAPGWNFPTGSAEEVARGVVDMGGAGVLQGQLGDWARWV